MPTENRSSNTEMVSVPREWLKSVALLRMPLDELQEQAVQHLCEPCDEPAEQHQDNAIGTLVRDYNERIVFTPIGDPHIIDDMKVYTRADPGEVERLRARIAELEEHCKRLGQGDAERYWEGRWRDADAQLAEAQALLREAACHATRMEPMSASCLNRIDAHLDASAEPSAPVERDERAEFYAWFLADAEKCFPNAASEDAAWGVWQARAAIERKPS